MDKEFWYVDTEEGIELFNTEGDMLKYLLFEILKYDKDIVQDVSSAERLKIMKNSIDCLIKGEPMDDFYWYSNISPITGKSIVDSYREFAKQEAAE